VHISGYRYVLMVDASGPQLTGPFSTSAAARAWRRKNKIDGNRGYVTTLMLEIDKTTAKWFVAPEEPEKASVGMMRRIPALDPAKIAHQRTTSSGP
jgi:hypothetical protein